MFFADYPGEINIPGNIPEKLSGRQYGTICFTNDTPRIVIPWTRKKQLPTKRSYNVGMDSQKIAEIRKIIEKDRSGHAAWNEVCPVFQENG